MSPAPNPHLAHSPERAGVPLSQARVAAVLVHGRDQGPEVMADVAERLDLDGVAYVLPVADGRSWYPGRFHEPPEANEPHVSWALEALAAALALPREAGLGDERVVLGGFSQGACMVAELAARRPRPWAGVAVLTGSLLGPAGHTRAPAVVPGLPMFFASSRHDEWIPLERAQETAEAFAAAGAEAELEVYEDRVHHVSDRAVDGLRRLFDRAR